MTSRAANIARLLGILYVNNKVVGGLAVGAWFALKLWGWL